jgi:hypothetical protein
MRQGHTAMIAGAVSMISFEMSARARRQAATRRFASPRVAGGRHMSVFLRTALFFHPSSVEIAFGVCYGVR